MNANLRKQQGVTLIVGMIMLILLTLMAVTSFKLGKGNLQIVGNMQFRNETLRVAEEIIEARVSTPTNVVSPWIGGLNFNGGITQNANPDVAVTVTPTLVQAYVKKNSVINLNDPGQLGCTLGTAQVFGVEGAATGNSLCAAALYDLTVVATEAATNAKVELHQGVAIQVPADSVCSLVPC
ncbi:MAG TPA: hypothetical protein VF928_04190 [Usitatibacteraceae bacterium]